jgi:two-component sensor histidine kinase
MADPTQQTIPPRVKSEPVPLVQLSTGMKMLIYLSLALLPLGLIAIFASREAAQTNRLRHEAEARAAAISGGSVIAGTLGPATLALRRAVDDLFDSKTDTPIDREQCGLRLQSVLNRYPVATGAAMLRHNGTPVCSSGQYRDVAAFFPSMGDDAYEVRVDAAHGIIWTSIRADEKFYGVIEFPTGGIAKILPSAIDSKSGISLHQGSQVVTLRAMQTNSPLDQIVSITVPVEAGQIGLEMQVAASPLTAVDMLLILLPIVMWAAGGVIGWVVIDRLLLRPLGQMQRAIAVFTRGEGPLTLPHLKTPAREIRELGESFRHATETLTAHEQELAEGLDNQKKLTREVHHRVKNNLQVVSSLINLHARGSTSDAVSEAYASIQRRVDALAVVHRNHYAELEENQGVSLRALIGEIASNLRASTNVHAAHMTLTLNIMSASATQDTAVPIAFLITEIVELVMLCGPETNISISLTPIADDSSRALLLIAAPTLASTECLTGTNAERFQRIAGGLARQLRSQLHHEVGAGRYAIEISIIGG